MLDRVKELIHKVLPELIELNEYIAENPELGNEEYKARALHVKLLENHDFQVESGYLGIETAFRAEYNSGKPGLTVAYLSEYDALPEIGHGCGHCLTGTAGTGAGVILSKLIDEIGGKVLVFGTPAEETDGKKVLMTNKGAFDKVDFALMSHPAAVHYRSGKSSAMQALQFEFIGKSTHAAVSPELGRNALDGVISLFVNINAMREHILPDARIHGIITNGGTVANIVPDKAVAKFYIRAPKKPYLLELVDKVKKIAEGSAMATGTEVRITNYEESYDNFVNNETLADVYDARLRDMGVVEIHSLDGLFERGSLDAGNISQVCPMIHSYFGISDEFIDHHTKEFAEASVKPRAYDGLRETLGALVMSAIDVINDEGLFERIMEEFNEKISG